MSRARNPVKSKQAIIRIADGIYNQVHSMTEMSGN
jgi:hypothetical protein